MSINEGVADNLYLKRWEEIFIHCDILTKKGAFLLEMYLIFTRDKLKTSFPPRNSSCSEDTTL